MTLALLDGDIIAYRSSVTAEDSIEWGDGQTGTTINRRAAVDNALAIARTWSRMARADDVIVCLSPEDGSNFRQRLGVYKPNRGDKPAVYWDVIHALEAEYEVRRIQGLEADDVMGILATRPENKGSVIVSIDKDLQTIPCRLLDPVKAKRPRRISPLQADHFWMTQTLTGDRVDGYSGCPGIGPKKAERALEDCRDLAAMWRAVVETYATKELPEGAAILQARFARILRTDDYSPEKEAITLWHPNPRKRETLRLG